jgi:predicted DNA-binding protein
MSEYSIRIPIALFERLARVAAEDGRPIPAIIRELLADGLDRRFAEACARHETERRGLER